MVDMAALLWGISLSSFWDKGQSLGFRGQGLVLSVQSPKS